MPRMIHKMRIWDQLAANRVDYFVSNSNFIAQRIKKYYRRDAKTIYPPVHINEYPLVDEPDDYYLIVSRFVYYKRIDLAIAACNQLQKKLVIIGGGDEEKKLRAMAGPTIQFAGRVNDEEMMQYYVHAKAFLFPGEEDFGITPVEAQSAGCPVLAYGRALETVLDGRTGLFFTEQTAENLMECIQRFEAQGVEYDRTHIRQHSLSFSEERFRNEVSNCVNRCNL